MSHFSSTVKYLIPESAFADPLNPSDEEVYTWAINIANIPNRRRHGAIIVYDEIGEGGTDYKHIWRTILTDTGYQVLTLKEIPLIQDTTGPFLTDEELRAEPLEVTGTLDVDIDTSTLATHAKQDLLLTELEKKADLTETQPVSIQNFPSTTNIVTGNITTRNLVPTGVSTPGGSVEITLNGAATVGIQVTGTYTGALSLQATIDGTTWVTVGGSPFTTSTGTISATITSGTNGLFLISSAGYLKIRITSINGASTGSANLTLNAIQQTPLNFPTSASTVIGSVLQSGNWAVGTMGGFASVTTANGIKTASFISNFASAGNRVVVGIQFYFQVTAVSGSSPTLIVSVQESMDNVNFVDIPGAITEVINTTGFYSIKILPGLPTKTTNPQILVNNVPLVYQRASFIIGGSTPSFTIASAQTSICS